MSEYVYKQVETETHILKIIPDNDAESPREWDNLGTMVCFHSRHDLGDKHDYSDKDAMILDLLTEALGDTEKAENLVERVTNSFNRQDFRSWGAYERAIDEKLFETIEKKFILLPLYLYDHSGITMSTGSFSCSWDSGQVGWIYISLEKVRKEYSIKRVTKAWREKIKTYLTGEVETYDQYLTGDIYGFKLEKKNKCECCNNEELEVIDSCWGFFGTDFKTNGILDSLGSEFSELVAQL